MFAGHVQEIDSDIQRLAHNCNRLPGVLIDAKVVAAQPDDRRPYSGAPKFSHFHMKTPSSSLRCRYKLYLKAYCMYRRNLWRTMMADTGIGRILPTEVISPIQSYDRGTAVFMKMLEPSD